MYANNTEPVDFAEKIIFLLDNETERTAMGEYGYQRVINELSWEYESKKLVEFYKRVLSMQ